MEDMTMKEPFVKLLPVLALACFVIAVFMIAGGHFWNGIVFIGAGTSLSTAAKIHPCRKDKGDPGR